MRASLSCCCCCCCVDDALVMSLLAAGLQKDKGASHYQILKSYTNKT